MDFDPNKVAERLYLLGKEYAEKNEAAELLEETKKVVLSELSNQSNESSVAAKEAFALRHPTYKSHLEIMVEARKNANIAKVRYEADRVRVELLRTKVVNDREISRNS